MADQAAGTIALRLASDDPPSPPGTPPSLPDPDGPVPIEEPPTGIPVPAGDPVPVHLQG